MNDDRHLTRLRTELSNLDAVLWAFMELDDESTTDEITRLATECVRAKDAAIAAARNLLRHHDVTLTPSDPVSPRQTGSTVTTVTPSPHPPIGGVERDGVGAPSNEVTPSDGVRDDRG